ncbi:MAG TPA: lactate/malate dehydrogenase family protein [Thermoplasmata archaeon]
MKAGVVGVGKLGSTIAYALAHDGLWEELVLTDVVDQLAWAQAEDIRDGLSGARACRVRAGTLDDLKDADAVLLAAGQGRKPGMTRLDLLHTNAGLIADLSEALARAAPHAAFVVLTNPVDVMTTVAWEASGFPRERVLGSGHLLDSLRLRALLADRLKAKASEVDAIVVGEHGDNTVPIFSRVRVRGSPVKLGPKERDEIREELKAVAAKVIEVKGGTAFGPAGATAILLRALMNPEPSVVPASVVLAGEYGLRDIAVGVPAVLGKGRVMKVEEWPLKPDEQAALQEAGRDLARFAEDAAVLLGLAVRHTTLDKIVPPAAR